MPPNREREKKKSHHPSQNGANEKKKKKARARETRTAGSTSESAAAYLYLLVHIQLPTSSPMARPFGDRVTAESAFPGRYLQPHGWRCTDGNSIEYM